MVEFGAVADGVAEDVPVEVTADSMAVTAKAAEDGIEANTIVAAVPAGAAAVETAAPAETEAGAKNPEGNNRVAAISWSRSFSARERDERDVASVFHLCCP